MLHHLHPTCLPAGGATPMARWDSEDRWCLGWCFCVKCVRAQRSLGSIVEPRSTRAGDAPDQELHCGAPDSTQPAVLWPPRQLMQRAAEARTSEPAGAFHVSLDHYQSDGIKKDYTECKICVAKEIIFFCCCWTSTNDRSFSIDRQRCPFLFTG